MAEDMGMRATKLGPLELIQILEALALAGLALTQLALVGVYLEGARQALRSVQASQRQLGLARTLQQAVGPFSAESLQQAVVYLAPSLHSHPEAFSETVAR